MSYFYARRPDFKQEIMTDYTDESSRSSYGWGTPLNGNEGMSTGTKSDSELSNKSYSPTMEDSSRKKKDKKANPLISDTEKCGVCGEPAARHIHYGAVTCFSCRAFFRRSIQNGQGKQYSCRKDGNCEITLKTRKGCQKCRFQKCIDAGMKTTWVLTEEERFRR